MAETIETLQIGIEADANGYRRGLDDADRATDGFTGSVRSKFDGLGTVLTGLAVTGGAALTGLAGLSISMAGDYEASLNRLEAVTGSAMADAGLSLDDFNTKFLQLGKDTQFSAGQAGDAAVELAKGGVSVTDIMGGATDATLNLAAAGEIDLAEAAGIVAKQLGVWGSEGVTAEQITNRLAQAANASTVDVDELALGLSNVGGVAKVAGLDFDELNTTMALLAPGFSSAADAGTSFKSFLNNMIPTTADAKEKFDELGLIVKDSEKIMQLLRERGIEPVSSDFGELNNQLFHVMSAAGELDGTIREQSKQFDGLSEKLGITHSAFYDTEGSFIGMEAASQKLMEATGGLSEAEKSLALEMMFGADAQRAAAILSEQGAEGYNGMATAMDGAGTAADQAALRNRGFNFALESLKGSLETVMIVLGQKLLPVVTDFINNALIPAVSWVLEFIDSVSAGGAPLEGLSVTVAQVFGQFQTWIGTLGPVITAAIPLVADAFAQFAQAAIQWVVDAAPGVLAGLAGLMQALGGWVMENAPAWAGMLLEFAGKLTGWVLDALPGLLTALGGFLSSMLNWVVASLPTWGAELLKLGEQLWTWVVDALPGLGTKLGEVLGVILTWIGTTIETLGPKLLELAGKFLNWITDEVLPFIGGKLGEVWDAITGWISSTATAIGEEIVAVKDAIIKPFVDAYETIVGMVADFVQLGTDIMDGITGAIWGGGGKVAAALTGVMSDAKASAQNAIDSHSPSRVFAVDVGQPIVEGIAVGITEGKGGLMASLGSMMSDLISQARTPAFAFAAEGPRAPSMSALPGMSAVREATMPTGAFGEQKIYNIDARNATDPAAVEQNVQRALENAGRVAEIRILTQGAF